MQQSHTAKKVLVGLQPYCESWIEDVVEVDGEKVKEPFVACSHDGIASVVNVSPGVGALRETAIGQHIEDTLREGRRV